MASEQVADALALCRKYGKPSFFITMTTNPKWPEILNALKPGQDASHVPSIVCRAFKARYHAMIDFIKKNFGKILYMVRVVEFQKRGLPHCHIIIKVCSF